MLRQILVGEVGSNQNAGGGGKTNSDDDRRGEATGAVGEAEEHPSRRRFSGEVE